MAHKSSTKIKGRNKAVFLDRDGTIHKEMNGFYIWDEKIMFKTSIPAVKKMNDLGYKIIIVTNQGHIGKGKFSKTHVDVLHKNMLRHFRENNAVIHAVYYCPHHPEAIIAKYKITCTCRKPGTQMFEEAIARFNIDPKKSFMIGDRTADILAGKTVGLRTILVKTGYKGSDKKYKVTPHFTSKNLLTSIKYLK